MNWNDPAESVRLINRVGIDEYTRLQAVVDADLEGIVAKRLADAISRSLPGGIRF
jgi:hypothetical protein